MGNPTGVTDRVSTSADSQVVLITGAGGGLGHNLVHSFAAEGWRVIAAHRRLPKRPETDPVWDTTMDVTQPTQIEGMRQAVQRRYGRIDLLVNNAGLTIDQPLWQLQPSSWDQVLRVNLTGVQSCTRALLPLMLAQRDGHIINIGSFAGVAGARGQSAYAAAKAGLLGFTRSLAREVADANVRVNVVLPGVLLTRLTHRLSPERRAELINANLLRRPNDFDEVARFIRFLASTRNISGQCFALDSRITPWS